MKVRSTHQDFVVVKEAHSINKMKEKSRERGSKKVKGRKKVYEGELGRKLISVESYSSPQAEFNHSINFYSLSRIINSSIH